MFFCYIDPGTGSMLSSIIIGLATTALFLMKGLIIKLKQYVAGGRVEVNKNKIPIVIFSDSKRYWNVFGPICDELENRGVNCEYWTMSKDDPALLKGYKNIKCIYIGEKNMAFGKLNTMNAKICLATTPGLDVLQWKRSKSTNYYIHIFHSQDDGTVYRMFALDHYDAVMLSGVLQEEPIRRLEAMRKLPAKELTIVGSPYMDTLMKRASGFKLQRSNQRTTILCAPSWGESSLLRKYGDRFLDALIKTGYNIIVRPHPQSFISEKDLMDRLQTKYPDSELIHWNRDNDNFDVLSQADLMISDFSTVIFDYCLVFNRPVIFTDTKFDRAPYDAAWLNEDPWTVRCMDTIGRKLKEDDFESLKEIIDEELKNTSHAQGRKKAIELVWAKRGESSVQAADYLVKKLQSL